MGEDDQHLDFRLSILKHGLPDRPRLTMAMTVTTHNRLGRVYLAGILPFHKIIMRRLLARAARRGAV